MRSLRPLSVGTCRGSHWKIFQWVSLVEERRIALCDVVPQPREKVSTSIRRTRLLPLVFHLILVQRMPRYADFPSAELLVNAVQFGLQPPLDGEAMEMLRPTFTQSLWQNCGNERRGAKFLWTTWRTPSVPRQSGRTCWRTCANMRRFTLGILLARSQPRHRHRSDKRQLSRSPL